MESLHDRLGILEERMGRIEIGLDRILGILELSTQLETAKSGVADLFETQNSQFIGELALRPNSKPILQLESAGGKYTYGPLDESKSEIRILALQRSDNLSDPVIASLKTISLDNQDVYSESYQGYTALSYSWGPPVFDGLINLNGCPLAVTKNLELALRYMRTVKQGYMPPPPTMKCAYWWIDQICGFIISCMS